MMETTVRATDLKEAVRFTKPASSHLFAGVRLERGDNELRVTATDGLTVRQSMITDLEDGEPGIVHVPHALLNGVAAKATGNIVLRDTNDGVSVRSSRTRFVLPKLDPGHWPNVTIPVSWDHEIGNDIWGDIQGRVLPFVGRDLNKPMLRQILVQDGHVYGTDSYRLSVLPTGLPDMAFPVEVLHGQDARVSTVGGMVFVLSGNNVVGAPLVAGEPRAYGGLIPPEWDVEVEVDASDLGVLVGETMALASNDSKVVLRFEGPELTVTLQDQDGVAEGTVGTSGVVDPLTIGFQAQFLADALKVFDGLINLSLIGAQRPMLLSDGVLRHLLIPVRL